MKTITFLIISIFGSISMNAQDFSPYYGVWRGKSTMADGITINEKLETKITFFGIDNTTKMLVGEMQKYGFDDIDSNKKSPVNYSLAALKIEPTKFSFEIPPTYTKDFREIKQRLYYELKIINGKKVLLNYALADDPNESTNKACWYFSYVGKAGTPPIGVETSTNTVNSSFKESATSVATTTNVNSFNQPALTEGAALLFKNVKSKLTNKEKNFIFENTALGVAPDKQRFIINSAPNTYPTDVEVFVLNLNNDKTEEVFVCFKSPSVSGDMEQVVSLFVRKLSGEGYRLNFGTMRPKPQIIGAHNGGYPFLYFAKSRSFPAALYIWDVRERLYMEQDKELNQKMMASLKSLQIGDIAKVYEENGNQAAYQYMHSIPRILYVDELFVKEIPKKIVYPKGSSAKFIGKYWELGYYNYPYTLTKAGNTFYLKPYKKSDKAIPPFTYNAKADRLETWVTDKGLKFKILLTFDYDNGSIYIDPENRHLQGMFPTHLLRYK